MIAPQSLPSPRVPEPGREARGFTLVELLVTMAIFALLLGLGVPALQRMVVKQQVRSASEALVQTLRYARSEAMRSGQLVTACRTDDPSAGTPVCATGSFTSSTGKTVYDWSTGWLLFMDHDADGKFDTTKGDRLLRVQNALSIGSAVLGTEARVSMQPLGVVASPNTGYSYLVDAAGLSQGQNGYQDIARCVIGSKAGRLRVAAPSDTECLQ